MLMSIEQTEQIKQKMWVLGALSGVVAVGAAIMSMAVREGSPEWMYSSNQVSNTSARIAFVFSAFNELLKKQKAINFVLGMGSVAALCVAAYEASLSLAKPALAPMWNAAGLFLSVWKFDNDRLWAAKILVTFPVLGALIAGGGALGASNFYNELYYTNFSLAFVSFGYLAKEVPEMFQSKKFAWSVGLSMLSSVVLEMVIAGSLKTNPVKILLGFSSAFFGLGAGLSNISDLLKFRSESAEKTKRQALLWGVNYSSVQSADSLVPYQSRPGDQCVL